MKIRTGNDGNCGGMAAETAFLLQGRELAGKGTIGQGQEDCFRRIIAEAGSGEGWQATAAPAPGQAGGPPGAKDETRSDSGVKGTPDPSGQRGGKGSPEWPDREETEAEPASAETGEALADPEAVRGLRRNRRAGRGPSAQRADGETGGPVPDAPSGAAFREAGQKNGRPAAQQRDPALDAGRANHPGGRPPSDADPQAEAGAARGEAAAETVPGGGLGDEIAAQRGAVASEGDRPTSAGFVVDGARQPTPSGGPLGPGATPQGLSAAAETAGRPLPQRLQPPAPAVPKTYLPQAIIERLVSAGMAGSGEVRRVRIQLDPPQLGAVNLEILMRGKKMEIVLTAGNPSLKRDLLSGEAEIRAALARQELEVDRFQVMLREEGAGRQQAEGDRPPDDSAGRRHGRRSLLPNPALAVTAPAIAAALRGRGGVSIFV